MTHDLMQFIDEEQASSGGGGTFVCQAELGVGYLVFTSGDRKDRYFRVRESSERDAQRAQAESLASKYGKRAVFCVTLFLYADSVLNRDETPSWKQAGPGIWAHDLPVYTDGWTKVLSPSIQANFGDDTLFNERFWAHVDLVPDPYNERSGKTNRVPQIVQVFDSKKDAVSALEDLGAVVSGVQFPDQPEQWNTEALGLWKSQCEDILNHFKEDPTSDGSYYLMPQFGVDQDILNVIKAIADEESLPF